MLSYSKLWLLLESKGMKRTDLKEVISGNTLAKLGKNETISSGVIEKLCEFLDCQPGDIMEYISEKNVETMAKQFDSLYKVLGENLQSQGLSEEQVVAMMRDITPGIIKGMFNGGTPMMDIFRRAKEQNEEESE